MVGGTAAGSGCVPAQRQQQVVALSSAASVHSVKVITLWITRLRPLCFHIAATATPRQWASRKQRRQHAVRSVNGLMLPRLPAFSTSQSIRNSYWHVRSQVDRRAFARGGGEGPHGHASTSLHHALDQCRTCLHVTPCGWPGH
jgi:hypothetical protein